MTAQPPSVDGWQTHRRAAIPIGGGYDRFVAVTKVALPALSFLLFATILVWPAANSQEMSFVLSKDRVETSPERLRMEYPSYRGVDSKGRPFEISARRAVQKTSATPVVELTDVSARISLVDGDARVRAATGSYDLESEKLTVIGDLKLETDSGYRFATRDAIVDLASRTAYGKGGVDGTGPLGHFSASGFRADIATHTVVFEGRTSTRITPRP
ncbi:LPS export ABC transporter periplasmic protein LptC [Parapedomonas caeni]